MAPLCPCCAGMTFARLVELAREECTFDHDNFPERAYYAHHASFAELEQCATASDGSGCPLCLFLLDSLRRERRSNRPAVELRTWDYMVDFTDEDPDMSMYEAAKKVSVSDIRIALDTRHIYSNGSFDQVKMLDLLAVQVGEPLRFSDYNEEEEKDEYPFRVSTVNILLQTPRSSPLFVDGIRVGRFDLDPDLGSQENFAIARSWLGACRFQHHGPGCLHALSDGPPPRLPTRVVDVDSDPPRVVLADEIHAGTSCQGRAEYVALSHCWGGPVRTLLTTKTIADFREALPSSDELPPNFRDAIRITQELGIRYIWIDSLCIIQDTAKDWLHESRTMSAVYSQATISLLVMAAASSNAGILHTVPPSATSESMTILHDEGRGSSASPVPLTLSMWVNDEESLRLLDMHSPLSTRGWTLQELSLSTRILFYGKHQIYWHCTSGGYKAADGVPPPSFYPMDVNPDLHADVYADTLSMDGDKAMQQILNDYYQLTENYSQRHLTVDSDKLLAMSGIAQHIHQALIRVTQQTKKPEYVAGLWSHDIHRGLLFFPENYFCTHKTHTAKGEYRAPSWSWAMTDNNIMFAMPLAPTPHAINLQLCSWSVEPWDPENVYGLLKDAHLVVRGHVGYLRCSRKPLGVRDVDSDNEEDASPTDLGTSRLDDMHTTGGDGKGDDVDDKELERKGILRYYLCSTYFLNMILGAEGAGDADDERTFLCFPPGRGERMGPKDFGGVQWADVLPEKFVVLVVCREDVFIDEEGADGKMTKRLDRILTHCLVLRQVDQEAGVYERVGYMDLWDVSSEYIGGWPSETLKLV